MNDVDNEANLHTTSHPDVSECSSLFDGLLWNRFAYEKASLIWRNADTDHGIWSAVCGT